MGDMPDNGTMRWRTSANVLSGYPVGTKTIDINYRFPSGQRDGKNYQGISRSALLPATPEGITIFKMLKLGF